ncbi:MAG: polyphosphate kinase 1 [Ignavibacteria bacterium]|nr:polyphosphate kinase 1 [Ignavibacteria bacterium]
MKWRINSNLMKLGTAVAFLILFSPKADAAPFAGFWTNCKGLLGKVLKSVQAVPETMSHLVSPDGRFAVEIYEIDGPLNLGDLMVLTKIENRKLKYEPFTPRISSFFREEDDVFKNISRQDIYLHHPFYSFSSVSEFIAQAAVDPKVYAIKLTLYRTSGDSAIINSLITAAENGKQVTAVVELKARFDEENNIIWARALENAGVHVVYGLIGLKTHCKIALVVRKEDETMKRYVHLSTGNYNQTTSKLYTDFGLFTANEDFGKDATQLFNYLTGYSKKHSFKELVVAPINMRKTILGLIDNEIQKHKEHNNGYILAKMNSLVDEEVILKLYEASNAGVKIELMVRGICRLKPGVKGMSENISVYSLVGRFLEHSRAFYFNNNGESNLYLSSADWMPRNLDRRIEIMFPIEDERVKEDILEVLKLYLTDNVKSRILKSDGTYEKLSSGSNKIDIQETFVRRVIKKHTTDTKKDIKKKIKKLAVKHLSIVK